MGFRLAAGTEKKSKQELMNSLEEQFKSLAKKYSSNDSLIDSCWDELAKNYSSAKRHYHNLSHPENLFAELEQIQAEISDWNTICFSVFYHDAIYDAKKNDNEEQSALLAEKRLRELNVPEKIISRCKEQIIATKSHALSSENDTNLFTDADLSILGKSAESYEIYFRQIREEYSIYPDLLYKPGRKKVLNHFLEMKRIFKTDLFADRYEKQARENLGMELRML